MKKIIAAILAGMLAAVMLATPAHAAKSDCSNYPGTVCLFAGSNWGGPVWRQYPSQITGCRSLVPDGWNDVATMVMNNTPGHYDFIVWQHSNCTGSSFGTNPKYFRDLTGNWWDGQISAVQIIAY